MRHMCRIEAQVAVGFALLVDGNAVAREERQVAGGEVLRVHGADDVGENLLLGRRQVVGRAKSLGLPWTTRRSDSLVRGASRSV